MKSWEEFHPRVMPYVIGCPVPMVNQALIDASREFCLVSKAWRQTDDFPAFDGLDVLDFDNPTGSEVVQVIRASVNRKPLKILNGAAIPEFEDSVGERDAALYRVSEREYRILPQPSAGQTISITLALRPTQSGTGIGDDVFNKHVAAIAAGARAILQRMPRQDWSDMQQAQLDAAYFMREMQWAAESADFMQVSTTDRRVKAWG